jgi:hypothetical protein
LDVLRPMLRCVQFSNVLKPVLRCALLPGS